MRKKYLPIIFVTLLLAIIIFLWQYPSFTSALGIAFLLFSLAAAISSIFKKQREAYLQSKITRGAFMRNVLLEIFGILLAMALAGLLGRYIAKFATEQISNHLTKLIAGILIGLLVGMGMGVLVNRTWDRLVKTILQTTSRCFTFQDTSSPRADLADVIPSSRSQIFSPLWHQYTHTAATPSRWLC